MTEPRDTLDSLLQQSPEPPADPVARARHIDLAMEAFSDNSAPDAQGTARSGRLKEAVTALWRNLFGSKTMNRKTLCITGGALASLLTLGLGLHTYLTLVSTALEGQLADGSMPKSIEEFSVPPTLPDRIAEAQVSPEAPVESRESYKIMPSRNEARQSYSIVPESETFVAGGAAGVPAAPPAAPRLAVALAEPSEHAYQDQGRDRHPDAKPNPVKVAKDDPVSTFSIDVDTASYAFVRASLNQNVLPAKAAVRVEELINYFPYEYAGPEDRETPFKVNLAVLPTPWNRHTKLLHIGIRGYSLEPREKPPANLVFLIDTSGSMEAPNKLPLVKTSLKLLLDTLRAEDRVAIVTYAGSSGVALEPTRASERAKIAAVIDNLGAGGSTAGAEGIRQAYQLARQHFDKRGINRVILATDGDFNVGINNPDELQGFIERERNSGVYLSVLGFGMGNYNDRLMQVLAQNGNGNAAYIDTLNEARKTLVEEAGSTLFPIAKDVKIQVEFNPAKVAEYRLIGYETRLLKREDFNNDRVDAGEIGSGHTVTALYEVTPVGSPAKRMDDLRYGKAALSPDEAKGDEYAFVRVRYKLPDADESKLIGAPADGAREFKTLDQAPQESRFAAAVAAFGQLLRAEPYLENYGYDQVLALADGARGKDPFGYRVEFMNLVREAKTAPALPPLKR